MKTKITVLAAVMTMVFLCGCKNPWYTGPGSADGSFNAPFEAAVDSQTGLVYITDVGNSRIQLFEFCK